MTLRAYPNGATLEGLGVGADISTVDVASAVTNAAGGYVLTPDLTTLPSSFVEPDGSVSLEVDVSAGAVGEQSYDLSGAVPGTPAADDPETSAVAGRPDHVDFSLATGTVADMSQSRFDTSDEDGASSLTSAKVFDAAQADADSTPDASSTCGHYGDVCSGGIDPRTLQKPWEVLPGVTIPQCGGWKVMNYENNVPEHFVNVYTWGGAPAKITETTASSHSLGIELSVGRGAFGAHGSSTKETHHATSGVHTLTSGTAVSNGLNSAYEARACYQSYQWYVNTSASLVTQRELRPIRFFDVAEAQFDKPRALPTTWTNCDLLVPGDEKIKSDGTNVTYEGGISYAGLGSASAHVSFSRDTTIDWVVNQKSVFCGSQASGPNAGPAASPVAMVRAYNTHGIGSCGVGPDGDQYGDTPDSVIPC